MELDLSNNPVNDIPVDVDKMLESEFMQNKAESWNKLTKSTKTQKLHSYAEKYGKQHNYSTKEVRQLKTFLSSCLDGKRLERSKEIQYDKAKGIVLDIPGLYFHPSNHAFTLRADSKRVSTLSGLTPKRFTEKNRSQKIDDPESI